MSESAPKAEADGPEPRLLRDVFLIDARESVVSLEGWLARLPGADAARARERLVATAQRLEGTAKLVGYPGLARLAGLIGDTLEGASGDEAARRAAWIAGVVSAIRTTLATIADTGVEPADSVAAPPRGRGAPSPRRASGPGRHSRRRGAGRDPPVLRGGGPRAP